VGIWDFGTPGGGRLADELSARGIAYITLGQEELLGVSRLNDVVVLPSQDATDGATHLAYDCAKLASLTEKLAEMGKNAPRLWLVTRGGQAVRGNRGLSIGQSAIWGLSRTIVLEHPELSCKRVDLDPLGEGYEDLIGEMQGLSDGEDQVGYREGLRYVTRLVRSREAKVEAGAVRLGISTPGMLDGLQYRSCPRVPPGPGEVEVQVSFAALNFKDVLRALGKFPVDSVPLGSEFSGRVVGVGSGVLEFRVGDCVVGTASGAFGSFVTTGACLVAGLPERLSLASAVTLPIAFLTARYALEQVGRMKAGDRVLVHAAAGGVGLAAAQLAQRAGAEVIATAGSESKREWLRRRGIVHVLNSRSTAFAGQVLELTEGRGVDLVLNSLTGELIGAGLSVVASGGAFLEIGKAGIWDSAQVLGVRPDIRYEVLDWGELAERDPEQVGVMLREVMAEAQAGKVEALPYEVYEREETERAFRTMAQGKHRGKLVLRQCEEPPDWKSGGSYVITGGFGGLGLCVGEWLVGLGVRHVVLVGRHGAGAEGKAAIRRMEAAGAEVWERQADVSRREEVAGVLGELDGSGRKLVGVIHAAGVLDDGVLGQQTAERLERVLAPKVSGGLHLDELTKGREVPVFVLFSSLASVLGSAGQGNHAAANAFLDGLAHLRRSRGESGISIQWGAWSEVGSAKGAELRQRREVKGIGEMKPAEGLALLGEILRRNMVEVAAGPVDWERFVREGAGGQAAWLAEVVRGETTRRQEPGGTTRARPRDLQQRLEEAPAGQRKELLQTHVRGEAARILGLEPQRIDIRRPLSELGLDSLMSVELRNALAAALRERLQATILFKYPTVEALTQYLLELLGKGPEVAGPPVSREEADLETISDQQAEELLARELESAN
jgi:NADPH:quinone reductase-like Zn-dependent oxidoreductase/acyl carrier protein